MAGTMIRIQNLGIRFCDTDPWIFRHLQMEVSRGESAVILGPSGSGKSVFLKVLAGLISPTEGSVRTETSNIGMLFQKNALFDSLTCEENLLFPLGERLNVFGREAKKRAAEYLEAVNLSGTQELYPDEISGGMQKRLGIARALIVEPEVILYDEPTAGLDPITSRLIADLILSLRKKRDSTLVTVTNDVQRAKQMGDRIYLLAQGTLVTAGSARDLMKHTHPAIQQFIHGLQEGPLTGGAS